ncbi:MAG: sugar transferase [Terriglobia bacterium]|jgi:lipopolysaccharide/colanic/teichoic acid biosynthesis glycosyltransferase|nr:sugar transferase [Terriglobia bacterium]
MKLSVLAAAGLNGDRDLFLRQVAGSLAAIARETDHLGWYSAESVLGVIFTELGSTQDAEHALVPIENKVRLALQQQFDSATRSQLPVTFHICPQEYHADSASTDYPSASQRKGPRDAGWIFSRGKRTLDILGSVLALLLLSPLLCLIAIAVKLTSRGPVLFRQKRIGQYGLPFTFLKFRSMRDGNDSQIHKDFVRKLIAGSPEISNRGVFKLTHDPRVTPLGSFLRKTSLDELPQLWNVFRGDMSLVGPRPPLPYEVDAYDVWHRKRFLMAKPGITGLWQVSGRSRTTFDEMVRLDLRYARTSSFWLDAQILWRTPLAVIRGSGAY